jgi:hypothetical protein
MKLPELNKPDMNDPDIWASLEFPHQIWLRHKSQELGLDTYKIVLGNILTTIIGDDSNCFCVFQTYESDLAVIGKKHLLIRLDWEKNTEELPMHIRSQIQTTITQINLLDWSIKSEYLKAKQLWIDHIYNFTKTEIANNPVYNEAINYYMDSSKILHEGWHEFIQK